MWLVAAAVAAQSQSPSLQDAWIRETLDLDIRAAIQGYREVARDESHPTFDRKVAAARLEELRRIGVIEASEPSSAKLLPESLVSSAEAKAQETNAKAAADLAKQVPRASNPASPEGKPEVPPLRPLVSAVLQTLSSDAPAFAADRGGPNRTRGFGGNDTTRVLERIRAADIARASDHRHLRLRRYARPNLDAGGAGCLAARGLQATGGSCSEGQGAKHEQPAK
jgi:phage tail tape-measure protein